MSESLKDLVERGPVVFDGAMGTLLYSRGIFINRNFDELNLSRPDLVEKVHADYLAAGAMVLTSNTFGANGIKLSRHGIEDRISGINREGVKLARNVAADKALVAGSMGPTGIIPDIFDSAQMEQLKKVFAEQAGALLEAGADMLLLETFRHPAEMQAALTAVRVLTDRPIVATMAFDEDCRTADGLAPDRIATLLAEWGADVIGANCGEGPSRVFECAPQMLNAGLPVLAQPNAGHPRLVEGRVIYMTTPEYFGEYAKRFIRSGIRLIGGCCGTTPDHIRQIAAEARMVGGGRVAIPAASSLPDQEENGAYEPPPPGERSALGRELESGFVVSVEVDPPPGADPSSAIEGARMLAKAGVRFVNIADGPRATARMAPMALAQLLIREAGVEPIVHVTCRDRNLLGIQADLMGAHATGLRNLLIITGDPSKLGDYPMATTVYDLDSVGLLRLVSNLNRGLEPSGRRMKGATAFVKGTGVEPGAVDLDREVDRLRKKIDAGAEFVMTQPVYDAEVMDRFLDKAADIGVPIVMGILPLASFRNAEFLHHEVPGMTIPEPIRDRMKNAGKGSAAVEEGVRIAREALAAFAPRVRGCYIMPPFDRFKTALAVLDGVDLPSRTG
ncbi:MAG: bifunctional homocysteine S-methyltransferase/methylenetetrahydrofolate reductase [Deltaproteobacteria bacterium]|nr:bifunctional homocysteine S-methyltransferase/methylenetetrahydrofolate reductase [Deltaproteobacteria bacterium]